MAGVRAGNIFDNPPPVAPTTPLQNQYKLYSGAVQQQAGDYGNLMQGYQNLGNNIQASGSGTYTPSTYGYSPTQAFTGAVSNLQDLAKTGGYSDQNIADLRARGISPIRAIYANAQQNVERQKSLSGGYSPNYAAVQAKMARDESNQIGDATQNVNAGLAQNIAQNKLQVAPTLASTTGNENQFVNNIGMQNTNTTNEAQQFNLNRPFQTNEAMANNLSGMRSLYGTTPAMSSLFGNQALSAAQLQEMINARGQQANAGIAGAVTGRL